MTASSGALLPEHRGLVLTSVVQQTTREFEVDSVQTGDRTSGFHLKVMQENDGHSWLSFVQDMMSQNVLQNIICSFDVKIVIPFFTGKETEDLKG